MLDIQEAIQKALEKEFEVSVGEGGELKIKGLSGREFMELEYGSYREGRVRLPERRIERMLQEGLEKGFLGYLMQASR